MTFRELFKQQKGYDVIANNPLSVPCPHKFGYEHKNPEVCRRMLDCKSCWEREVPEKKEKKDPLANVQWKVVNIEAEGADNVNHPQHYTNGGIECIDAIESATDGLVGFEAVCTAQVIKYIWRWKWKNGAEDLKKAKWYLDRLIGKEK